LGKLSTGQIKERKEEGMERGTKRKLHKRDNKQGEEGPKRRKTERRKKYRWTIRNRRKTCEDTKHEKC